MIKRGVIYTPYPGSSAFRGIAFIRSAGKPVAATELADLCGCTAKAVTAVFALAIQKGALVKELIGNRAWYSIGQDIPLPARKTPSASACEQPAPQPSSRRVSSVFELGALAQIDADAEAAMP